MLEKREVLEPVSFEVDPPSFDDEDEEVDEDAPSVDDELDSFDSFEGLPSFDGEPEPFLDDRLSVL